MTVRVDSDGPVRTITIDRPDRRNAVDGETAVALTKAFRAFDADDSIAVGVLTGARGTFCAGADLKAILDGWSDGGSVRTRSLAADEGPMGPTRMLCSKPVIAAVEGSAVAGGLELALWCDLRVAARDAVFGVFCRRWGVPACLGRSLVKLLRSSTLVISDRSLPGERLRRRARP